MNTNLLLLTSINNRINQITFPQPNYYFHAKNLCYSIFNNVIKAGGNFQTPKEFHSNYFKKIITKPETRLLILRELKSAGILISTGYSTGKHKKYNKAYCKSYSFGRDFIYNSPVLFTQFKNINKTNDRMKFKELNETFKTITVNPAIYNFIPEQVEKELKSIVIGNNITNKMVTIKINKVKIKKPLPFWLADAARDNVELIKFKDKFYLEEINSFIKRKRIELNLIYNYTVEQIVNSNFYANRNETNDRLDYNFTGLKKEFFPYIYLDGELTEEIDIKNAQFALLSNISDFKLDDKFKEKAQSGQLYEYIGENLNMSRDEVKEYLIVVSFGETKNHQKSLNRLFPVTMQAITDFKNEFGYKNFSIMLQKAESNLMIDGVFTLLYQNNIQTLPIHDSMRVKKSDSVIVKKMIEDFFIEKEFFCSLKEKN